MRRPARFLLLANAVVVGCTAAVLPPAWGQADSRSVDIIDAPTPGPAATTPAPSVGAPSESSVPKPENGAELSLDIAPGAEIAVGTKVTFRISTRKEGYLLLLDVDAAGKLTQIYPNPMSVMSTAGDPQDSNQVRPGKSVLIPDPTDPYAGFEFVASPPQGTAMVVALLSDRPVQMIDLPDVPDDLLGHAQALTYLEKAAGELRIPSADSGPLQEARWSVAATFYSVR
jgi:hypothetical protein